VINARVSSGVVLFVITVAVVWFAPPLVFLVVAEALLLLAAAEYSRLARASGLAVPAVPAGAAAVLTCAAFSSLTFGTRAPMAIDVVLISAVVALGALTVASWTGSTSGLGVAAAALMPSLYLGLPIGAMVATREAHGPAALFLVMLTVIVSDIAQYYTGRWFGRRPLALAISPHKTMEGAVGGVIAGGLLFVAAGHWWLPAVSVGLRAPLGLAVVVLGITGDLFESMLKRSAGAKDSSTLIPGHGGVLDRVDALLFAAPVYYVVLKFV
jgi:phosphatidate cytidylyltransferase